ncbi:MAG TPA: diphthine--ammonia ligase [Candidatus Thermoplasmatota archaeon]|jgi:ABC transporter with metal-binding/Fe-S-binding domain ATP-binding protein|nr:diphthine--ammonia ligase [Candidatus Thermoplasmatota archaeon]
MRVAALFSGGKDSAYAIHVAEQWGWDVSHLVTVAPAGEESMMFHWPNVHLTPLLAQAMGKEHVLVEGSGAPEREVDELAAALRPLRVDGIVSGAVASEYQRTRLERMGHRVGLKTWTPIWHKAPLDLLRSMRAAGLRAIVAGCFAEGLDARWLGRELDDAAIAELAELQRARGIHPGGEGGEYESLALEGPGWGSSLEIVRAEKEWQRDRGVLRVREARLVPR